MKHTDVSAFIADLDGGQLEALLGKVLTTVGLAVCEHDGKGEVTLKLKMDRIGNSNQINIGHFVSYDMPTSRGHISEKTSGVTAMYCSATQGMTYFPSREKQGSLLDKTGKATPGGHMPPETL
jgi:hypothetical protein